MAFRRSPVRSQIWKARKPAVREELASAERAAKAIQDKLDRLDEAFLFERSIDIETYDRHAEKLREELTLARMGRHSGQLEELDVEGILAFAERVLPRAADLWVQASLDQRERFQQLLFRTESRSTEIGLLEPAQPNRLSATCGRSEPKMKVWWTRPAPDGTASPLASDSFGSCSSSRNPPPRRTPVKRPSVQSRPARRLHQSRCAA